DGIPVPFGENALKGRKLIEKYVKDYQDTHKDEEVVAVMPHGNGMFNEGFIIFAKGRTYYPWNEPYSTKPYTCFVARKNGAVSVEELEFDENNAYIAGTKKEKPAKDILYALSGQRIVHNSGPVDLASLYDQFTDLKQIFLYPRFKYRADGRDLFFGMESMYKNKDAFRKAFAGEAIDFSDIELKENGIAPEQFRAGMAEVGYKEGEDYNYDIDAGIVSVYMKLNHYAHNLIGVDKNNNIVAITCPGDSQRHVGITIKDLQKFVVDNGVKDVILLSNGTDIQIRDGDNNKLLASAGARDEMPAVLLIVKKRNALQKAWTAKMAEMAEAQKTKESLKT
ncbi:MAG: hypothetical protein NT033_04325, partial [Candidatus Omnitrophica bacterium]|nr:hypothetical protein [Candidatus Omnitrophota bacterium]